MKTFLFLALAIIINSSSSFGNTIASAKTQTKLAVENISALFEERSHSAASCNDVARYCWSSCSSAPISCYQNCMLSNGCRP